jgi:hypothetical protein
MQKSKRSNRFPRNIFGGNSRSWLLAGTFAVFSLSLIAIAFLSAPMPVSQPASAQEPAERTITASGEGTVAIPTTQTQVRLGVEIQGKTASEVQQEVAKRSQAVVSRLQERNVEKLETTGIRLNPNYNYQNNQRRLVGYVGVNTVSFKIPTQQAGSILDEAVNAGATRIDGVSFTATEDAIAQARKQALRAATQDAKAQAETVLNTLELASQEIVSIQINSASAPSPRTFQAEAARAAADASTPVMGGEQEVRASVTLKIRY